MSLVTFFSEKLNGKTAKAVAHLVIILSPVMLAVAAYAADRFLDERITKSPVIIEITKTQAETNAAIAAHITQIQDLKKFQMQTEVLLKSDAEFKRDVSRSLTALTREFDRLAGAIEQQNKYLDRGPK